MDRKVQKTINILLKNAYIVENMDKNVQKTIKKWTENAYIVEKCAKLCKKWTKNAYIGGKMDKNDQKMDEKCIYRRKNDQKRAKNIHFSSPKRIYRENFAHFWEK